MPSHFSSRFCRTPLSLGIQLLLRLSKTHKEPIADAHIFRRFSSVPLHVLPEAEEKLYTQGRWSSPGVPGSLNNMLHQPLLLKLLVGICGSTVASCLES